MTRQTVNPPHLFDSRQYGFSQVVVSAPGTMVFVSGQVAWDEKRQIVGAGDLDAQTRKTLENVARAVEAAGGTLADVVSLRIYILQSYLEESGAIRQALLDFFPENPPATTWIGVAALANKEFLIEIEATAVLTTQRDRE